MFIGLIVAVPVVKSPYQKVAVELPAGILSVVTNGPPSLSENIAVRELLVRVTGIGVVAVATFPNWSTRVTVNGPRFAKYERTPL
jgi:hypothetical protein